MYLTREAGRPLITKLKNLKNDDLVWGTNKNPSFSEKNESTQFSKICDKAGYSEKYKSNSFRKITLYSFRSFFFGKAADVHREGYAHKMIGHGGYLPQYDRMSDEKKIEWFIELEPDLTIFDEERNKMKSQKIEREKSELKTKESQIDDLQKKLEEFKKESKNEIEKLKYYNEISSAYLEKGEFPKIEKRGGKRMIRYKSLDDLKKSKK